MIATCCFPAAQRPLPSLGRRPNRARPARQAARPRQTARARNAYNGAATRVAEKRMQRACAQRPVLASMGPQPGSRNSGGWGRARILRYVLTRTSHRLSGNFSPALIVPDALSPAGDDLRWAASDARPGSVGRRAPGSFCGSRTVRGRAVRDLPRSSRGAGRLQDARGGFAPQPIPGADPRELPAGAVPGGRAAGQGRDPARRWPTFQTLARFGAQEPALHKTRNRPHAEPQMPGSEEGRFCVTGRKRPEKSIQRGARTGRGGRTRRSGYDRAAARRVHGSGTAGRPFGGAARACQSARL